MEADLFLLDIQMHGTCALAVGDGSTLALTLSGENTLQSGAGRAGIFVAEGADLVIDGNGSLSATGGHSAAGIGGVPTKVIKDVARYAIFTSPSFHSTSNPSASQRARTGA